MHTLIRQLLTIALWWALAAGMAGCGSTRTSNTMRTATEQMLISDAIDRMVDTLDFRPLGGHAVYFDDRQLVDVVDRGYLVSSLRQRMLASGCVLKDSRDDAEIIVEPRAGAVGTDNHDLLFGIPALQVPQVALAPALPAAIPEIPFAKRRDQRGVAKVAVFAYRRDTGEPVWQSGIAMNESTANDIWVFGAGPFKRGTIYDRTQLADSQQRAQQDGARSPGTRVASVNDQAIFAGLHGATPRGAPPTSDVLQASAALPPTSAAPTERAGPADVPPPQEAPLEPLARPLASAPTP